MTLAEYLNTPEGSMLSKAEWSRRMFISRGYMTQLVAGDSVPSLGLAIYIEKLTEGAVPANSWPAVWPVGQAAEAKHAEDHSG